MIYSFRYRHARFSVIDGHLEARDLAEATKKAETYCNTTVGCVFIPGSVKPWLIEVALDEPATAANQADDAGTLGKPSGPDQRKALTTQAAQRKAGTGVGSLPQTEERIGA